MRLIEQIVNVIDNYSSDEPRDYKFAQTVLDLVNKRLEKCSLLVDPADNYIYIRHLDGTYECTDLKWFDLF